MSSSSRMPSVGVVDRNGTGVNLGHNQVAEPTQHDHSTGDRNRTCDLLTSEPDATTNSCYVRINKRPASESNADKRGSKPHRCTSSRGVRAEGIEPIVLWLEARHSAIELRTQFQAEGARIELARQCQCSAAFVAAAITNWLALPYSAPAAGIEPA